MKLLLSLALLSTMSVSCSMYQKKSCCKDKADKSAKCCKEKKGDCKKSCDKKKADKA